MSAHDGGGNGKRRDISVYRYYKCSGVKRRLGCDKKTVRKDWIERLVLGEIKKLVHNDEAIAYIANCVMEIQGKTHTILPYLREQLAEVEKGIENLVNAIQMGIFNDAIKKRMDALESRKAEINIQIAKEELTKPTVTKDQIVCWLEHFRTFDVSKLEHRRRFIDTFINRIFLYDVTRRLSHSITTGKQKQSPLPIWRLRGFFRISLPRGSQQPHYEQYGW